jgi:hypothetical protein
MSIFFLYFLYKKGWTGPKFLILIFLDGNSSQWLQQEFCVYIQFTMQQSNIEIRSIYIVLLSNLELRFGALIHVLIFLCRGHISIFVQYFGYLFSLQFLDFQFISWSLHVFFYNFSNTLMFEGRASGFRNMEGSYYGQVNLTRRSIRSYNWSYYCWSIVIFFFLYLLYSGSRLSFVIFVT